MLNIFPSNLEAKTNNTLTINKNYPFYKEDRKTRYLKYKRKNQKLTEQEIIIRVNLNLDKDFYTNTKKATNLNTPTVLVNKYNYLDKNYIPNNLEEITSCVSGTKFLVKNANDALKKMCEDIRKENLQIRVISSYRSYNYQDNLYNNYVKKDGIEKADTYSARPGFSEHQTGLVIDVDNIKTNYENFENTKEFNWMQENAHKYGFILRYPKGKEDITGYNYESWHFRYVGKDIAKEIYKQQITFDEYYIKYIEK